MVPGSNTLATVTADQGDRVAELHSHNVGYINQRQVHGDASNNGCATASHQHRGSSPTRGHLGEAVRHASGEAITVPDRHCRDAGGGGRNVRPVVAQRLAGGNVTKIDDASFP